MAAKKTPKVEHEAFGTTQVHVNHYDDDGKFLFMTVEERKAPKARSEPPKAD